jgi:3-oxoacyl-[acyl-carrier-protein] synthase-1/3-oxoacyl-[acyl-carrier-protein] synthase II
MRINQDRRVVVTGMATINPLGDTLEAYHRNLLAGKSGIRKWTTLKLDSIECTIGGDLGDYDVVAALDRLKGLIPDPLYLKVRKLFRTCTFSNKMTALCAMNAYLDAGLFGAQSADLDPFRTSVLLAGHNFNSRYVNKNHDQFNVDPTYIDPLLGVEGLDQNIAATVSEVLSVKGPVCTIGAACASGNYALRDGFRDIVMGECDRSVVAGAPFDMAETDMQAMVFLNSIVIDPRFQDRPEKASRPFDTQRCGFLPSHGSAVIILEELQCALERGARIYAELLNVKANADACHLPSPSSENQKRLIVDLLKSVDVAPESVDYVNCHATSTPLGDLEEIKAIKAAFGSHAHKLKLNAPKSMLGHTCWAAPLVESVGAILQMNGGVLHPSINIDNLDPAVDLDVCANEARQCNVRYMLKNSFGFGGLNSCSLYKRFEG